MTTYKITIPMDIPEWRNKPEFESEPLDPEVIPLCDALNRAGFITMQSCSGHGSSWPMVWFEHSDDERIESLARYVLETEKEDFFPYSTNWKKEIHRDGYSWSVRVHSWIINSTTPEDVALQEAARNIAFVAQQVDLWREGGKAL